MAGSMQFDLVSPERSLASFAATEVQIPGADGDMTAMPDHAPTLTTLRPGVLVVKSDGGADQSYIVTGGFAEISPAGVSILAERAVPKADLTADDVASMVAAAEAVAAGKSGGELDAANKTLSDIRMLGASLGY